jgi:hypothetical protein
MSTENAEVALQLCRMVSSVLAVALGLLIVGIAVITTMP